VRQRSVDAVLVGRVRIGRGLQTLGLRPRVLAPHLRPAEKYALLGCEAVHLVLDLRARPGEIGDEREAHAAVVRRVLAGREAAVDVRVGRDRIARVLIGHARGALFIRVRIGRRPPVAQVAVTVELAPLIVEAVRELVADYGAGGAVIDGGVAVRAVERRLQDAG